MFKAIGRFFQKIKTGLAKTRSVVGDALLTLIGRGRVIDQAFLDELEDILLKADIGVAKSDEIVTELKRRYKAGEVAPGQELLAFLKQSLRTELAPAAASELAWAATGPTVVLIVGVNGAGKTTTIAKLAKRFKDQGKSVLIAAGDTYRAAAIEQLSIWAERVGVEIVKTHTGADAAAVAYDAVASAMARKMDVVLIDTAGRLHNKEHLMRELAKIRRHRGSERRAAGQGLRPDHGRQRSGADQARWHRQGRRGHHHPPRTRPAGALHRGGRADG